MNRWAPAPVGYHRQYFVEQDERDTRGIVTGFALLR
jgi:hypothetical protein